MSAFIADAALTGFKEGLKAGVVWLVFSSFLRTKERYSLLRPFYAAMFFTALASAVIFELAEPGARWKEYLSNFISMSFGIFMLASGAALFQASAVKIVPLPISGLAGRAESGKASYLFNISVFLLTLLFFCPDISGAAVFLKELAGMKDDTAMTAVSALSGLSVSLIITGVAPRLLKPSWIGSFFDLPQLLLFLAVVKLLGGGIEGLSEISLIPSIQRGFMKFSHDFIHQTFVILMVPDHPLLKVTAWNFIGFFFGSNIAIIVSLVMLLFFPFLFIHHSLIRKMPEPEAQTAAGRRKIKSVILSERRRKALPVMLFISLILFSWFSGRGESVSQLYNPKPKPLVEDRGTVLIPVNDPTMSLMDGSLHKFSLGYQGKEIRLIAVMKPDKSLAVCLDACEICPPEGYGQREDLVVCIYCNTPIPVSTLGKAGGCNPIPLAATVDERFVRISIDEIMKKWEYVKSEKMKGAAK